MICLGNTHFEKYVVWVTTPYSEYRNLYDPAVANLSYYLVSVWAVEKFKDNKKPEHILVSRNLARHPDFNFLFQLDKDYRPTKTTDMVQYEHYMETKDFGGNLYKLSRENVIKLFRKLNQIGDNPV